MVLGVGIPPPERRGGGGAAQGHSSSKSNVFDLSKSNRASYFLLPSVWLLFCSTLILQTPGLDGPNS